MLQRLLYLQAGELKRLLPFFGFYLALSTMLSTGDGLSLALFVHQVGANQLPLYYGITGVLNLLLIALYMGTGEKLSNLSLFRWILIGSSLSFLLSWAVIQYGGGGAGWYGLFFISREISYTMVLMHFGNFLQDYFTRLELRRILPLVYSAGRIGGILGGLLLGTLSPIIGTMNLVLLYTGLGIVCLLLLWQMEQLPHVDDPGEEQEAPKSFADFWKFLTSSQLLLWLTAASFIFVICRQVLILEYNHFFEHYFSSDAKMAEFMGWYTAIALTVSLVVQVLVINRMVAWAGVTGAHFIFSFLLLGVMGVNLFPMTLSLAIFSRLMETEFRVGFRNPLMMIMNNHFPKGYRKRSRAWSMGTVIPLATLSASLVLGFLQEQTGLLGIAGFGVLLALLYVGASVGLYQSFGEQIPFLTRKTNRSVAQPLEEIPLLSLDIKD